MGDEAVWGTWRLLSFECERSDGRRVLPFGPDAFGQLIYGSDGRMSAILSRRDRVPLPSGDPATSSEAERAALADGFAAYGGTYIVGAGTVTHEVEASFLPNWVGARLVRRYVLDGGRLTLSTPWFESGGVRQRAHLLWERMNLA